VGNSMIVHTDVCFNEWIRRKYILILST